MKEYIVPVGDKGNMTMIENELHLQAIVRCKNCKKRNQHKECIEGYGYHSDDWFCADGVAKDFKEFVDEFAEKSEDKHNELIDFIHKKGL